MCFGVDVAEDRAAWVAVAWEREDGDLQVMLGNDGQPMPAYKLPAEAKRLTDEWAGPVLGPKAFEDELDKEGVDALPPMSWADFAGACSSMLDRIQGRTIHHGNQPSLNEAVRVARFRQSATGGERAFQLKDAPELGPLAAVVRAVYGLEKYQSGFSIH